MKKFLLLILLFYAMSGIAQTLTKKYNDLNNRHEYFDSQGSMVGYQFYDNLDNSWKYYELPKKQESTYIQPVNITLLNRALASKQSRFDANIQKIDDAISEMRNEIAHSSISQDVKNSVKRRFNSEYMEVMYSKNYNFSSTSLTSQVINWLRQGFDKIVEQETNIQPKNQSVQNGTYVTLPRKASIWDYPEIAKAKCIGEMQTNEVYVIEKTNSQFYKIKSGNITGYITAINFK